jgi:hypothetical protein
VGDVPPGEGVVLPGVPGIRGAVTYREDAPRNSRMYGLLRVAAGPGGRVVVGVVLAFETGAPLLAPASPPVNVGGVKVGPIGGGIEAALLLGAPSRTAGPLALPGSADVSGFEAGGMDCLSSAEE